jgi:hypothetical protein
MGRVIAGLQKFEQVSHSGTPVANAYNPSIYEIAYKLALYAIAYQVGGILDLPSST